MSNALHEFYTEEEDAPIARPDYVSSPTWADDAKWAAPLRERAVLARAVKLLSARLAKIDADVKAELFRRNPGIEHAGCESGVRAPAQISTSAGDAYLTLRDAPNRPVWNGPRLDKMLKIESTPSPEGVAAAMVGVLASLIK